MLFDQLGGFLCVSVQSADHALGEHNRVRKFENRGHPHASACFLRLEPGGTRHAAHDGGRRMPGNETGPRAAAG